MIDTPWGNRWLNGATELHRLAVEDFVQLERRTEEIKEANINATCWLDSVGAKNIGRLKEVRQAPIPLPTQVTPLYLACWFQAWDSALLLLSRGADPNKVMRPRGGTGPCTALYGAALHGSTAVCKSLLESGARQDLDIGEGNIGLSCIYHHCCQIPIIILSKTGVKPLDAARKNKHQEVVRLFEASPYYKKTLLQEVVRLLEADP